MEQARHHVPSLPGGDLSQDAEVSHHPLTHVIRNTRHRFSGLEPLEEDRIQVDILLRDDDGLGRYLGYDSGGDYSARCGSEAHGDVEGEICVQGGAHPGYSIGSDKVREHLYYYLTKLML